jgi:hypothetical protein
MTELNIVSKKLFIYENSNELSLEDRRELLQIIYNSQFRNKISEKGSGVQIKLDELSQSIIDKLYTTIVAKLNNNSLQFT